MISIISNNAYPFVLLSSEFLVAGFMPKWAH